MPLRWHVNLPGPVAYSRPMRRKRRSSGFLTTLLVWFIVKPFELMFRGLAACFSAKPNRAPVVRPVPNAQFWPRAGWYYTQYGYLFYNGVAWVRPDGRPF